MESEKLEKKMFVMNNSNRIFTTSAGDLRPQESKELPEKEALNLLGYHGIIDPAKMVNRGKIESTAKAEIDNLKVELAKLEKEKAKLVKENAELVDELAKLKKK